MYHEILIILCTLTVEEKKFKYFLLKSERHKLAYCKANNY